jgi:hypothetical protein
LGWGGLANASESSFSLGYTLDYSDNALLVHTNQKEEWTHVLSAGLSYLENSKAIDARVQAQAAYRKYKNNIFADDTVLGLNANLLWRISPDRFSWTLEDYLTQTAIQSLRPDTPSNRQQTNVFTTGPDFKLRLSPVQVLQFGVRHTRNTYETSDLDNTRNSGAVKWIYQSSPSTTLSLNYDAQKVNYDNEILNPNFDRQDAFLGIEKRLSSNFFVLNAGATSIQREKVPDVDGSLGRFSWTRLVSPVSTFALSISSELSDVGREALAAGQTAPPNQQSVPGASVTGDVFRAKNASVTFTHRRVFGSDVIEMFKSKNEYKLSHAEEERKGGSFDISYELSEALAASVFARYVKTESAVVTPAAVFTDKNYGLRFSDRLTRNLNLGLVLSQNRRDNVDILQSYTERHAMLTLSYNDSSYRSPSLSK